MLFFSMYDLVLPSHCTAKLRVMHDSQWHALMYINWWNDLLVAAKAFKVDVNSFVPCQLQYSTSLTEVFVKFISAILQPGLWKLLTESYQIHRLNTSHSFKSCLFCICHHSCSLSLGISFHKVGLFKLQSKIVCHILTHCYRGCLSAVICFWYCVGDIRLLIGRWEGCLTCNINKVFQGGRLSQCHCWDV